MAEKGNLVSDALLRQITNLIKAWRNFKITGNGVEVRRTDDTFAVSINPKFPNPPAISSNIRPVTLTQTGGSDGTTSAAPTWTYTVTDFAGVQLATAVAPAHNRPYGKTLKATFGWARLNSGAWQVFDSDERPNFGPC